MEHGLFGPTGARLGVAERGTTQKISIRRGHLQKLGLHCSKHEVPQLGSVSEMVAWDCWYAS
jgi:hypothetical protein